MILSEQRLKEVGLPELSYTVHGEVSESRGDIHHLAFSPDAQWLAGCVGYWLIIWNVISGREFHAFHGKDQARSVFWLGDSSIVYVAFASGWLVSTELKSKVRVPYSSPSKLT
jgi:hypothetical protein